MKKMENSGYFKILKSPLTVSLAYDTSWSVFKSFGKGLEHSIDESKARKAAFSVRSIREFWKTSVDP